MDEIEFRKSKWSEDLRHLLEQEPLRTALSLVEKKPDNIPVSSMGAHFSDAVVSRMFAEAVGINKAVKHLRRLATPPTEVPEAEDGSERPQWDDGVPDHIRAAYIQQQQMNRAIAKQQL